MRILVLAQKGDWTACESALKALERSVVENLLNEGARQPLARISDTVRSFTVAIRSLQPKLKFPAKIEITFS